MRHVWASVCLVVILVACGGGLTLSQYAEQSGELVTTVVSRIDTLDAEWESQVPTVEGAADYWDRRLDARVEFLEGMQALDPPKEVADLHAIAVDLFTRLNTAEAALAARAATFETLSGHGPWWDTPEGQAARAIDDETVAICRAAQEGFDATENREALRDVPWIPSELKEVVQVAYGCPE